MKKHFSQLILAFAALVLLFVVSCTKDDTPAATTQNLDEVINSNADFSMFAHAIKKSKLDIFTKGPGPFTFFIPSNSSFAAAGYNSIADLDKLDPLFLAILTTYHFQGVERTFYEIPEGPNASMSTQTGLVQYGTRLVKEGKAFINGVEILDKGTKAANGIYFKAAELIQPPYFSNALLMMESMGGNFSLMLQAISKTSSNTSFTTTASTVFGIPNSVMLANGYDSLTIANISGTAATTLANTLKYHVIPQRIFKSDFRLGNVVTRYTGNSVTIGGTFGNYTIKGKNNPGAIAVGNGVATGSGVFYSINQMLKP